MKLLINEDDLTQGVEKLAAQVSRQFFGKPLTIVGVLSGSVVLMADLIRFLKMPLRVRLVHSSNCNLNAEKPGPLAIDDDLLEDVRERHVLVVEDIFRTGETLLDLVSELEEMQPASLTTAVLLKKQYSGEPQMTPDYSAFEIPDEFVVGYGLHYGGAFRHLPYVAALEPYEMRKVSQAAIEETLEWEPPVNPHGESIFAE